MDSCSSGPVSGWRPFVVAERGRAAVTLRVLLLALVWLLAVPGFAVEPSVILLSWDGTRWDYPDRVKLPGLERVARDGVRAERLLPV